MKKRMRKKHYNAIISIVSLLFIQSLFAQATPAAPTTAAPEASTATPEASEYSAEAREYHLKAAFLRYVAKFIEWPTNSLPPDKLNICILGLVPSFSAINSINNKVVNERSLIISKTADLNEASQSQCQILFVTETEKGNITKIIKVTRQQPILTFGDMADFAPKGGDMNFYIANNRLAIMANLQAIQTSNLKINEQMLRLITVIPPH